MKEPTRQSVDDATGDSAVEQRSRELFDEQVANLDGRTRSRLNQARQAALAAARGESRSVLTSRWLLPVGSAAALALVTLSTVQIMNANREETPSVPVAVASTVDDVEILTSSEELDMLQNMDFYAWLDTQQDVQSDAVAEHSNSEAG